MKIWQRYLFGHLFRAFLFFLLCIIALYIIVDFSLNGARVLAVDAVSWLDIGIRYLLHFSKFTGLFFAFSFLLAMLRVLLDLSANREIVALQTAGLATSKILFPFYFLALIVALLSYANFEWIQPLSLDAENMNKSLSKHARAEKVFSLVLQDGSELVYQSYDPNQKVLFDVFWIRSFNEIWHMKTLYITHHPFSARFADRFIRGTSGALEKADSADDRFFPDIEIETGASFEQFIPFENRPLSTLWCQAKGVSADKQKSRAHLHYKLAIPLIPFFLILTFAPFALRYSRSRSSLIFASCSLFAFIGLMTLLDALLILGENQALSHFAIWTPLAACLAFSIYSWQFKR